MAPRPVRRQPNPPDRSRNRQRVPPVPPLHTEPSRAGLAYERTVLAGERTTRAERLAAARAAAEEQRAKTTRQQADRPDNLTARARAQRAMSYDTAMAIQMSKAGDDSLLLPYQPTPSINPPRPRTHAAGYDPDAKVLRVRFRDGTPWEYYNVSRSTWEKFKQADSPGRFINRVLNKRPYAKGNF